MDAAATVVTLIQLAVDIVKYLTALKNAPKIRNDILESVKSCEIILQDIKIAPIGTNYLEAWLQMAKILEALDALVQKLMSLLSCLREKISPRKGIRKAWRL